MDEQIEKATRRFLAEMGGLLRKQAIEAVTAALTPPAALDLDKWIKPLPPDVEVASPNGSSDTIAAQCAKHSVPVKTYYSRRARGYSHSQCLTGRGIPKPGRRKAVAS